MAQKVGYILCLRERAENSRGDKRRKKCSLVRQLRTHLEDPQIFLGWLVSIPLSRERRNTRYIGKRLHRYTSSGLVAHFVK